MTDTVLRDFVETSLRAGETRPDTKRVLLAAGWASEQVDDAMRSFAEVEFSLPVPRPKAGVSARDAFLYLVMFGMLYVTAYNLGILLFQFINLGLPDPLTDANALGPGSYVAEVAGRQIRWAISSLLVAFPVFLFVSFRVARGIALDPTLRTSGVRKWLTYITLFLGACIIVGDLITLLYNLLSGELTLRITLKAMTVGGIAGAIFAYYLWSMRADDRALAQ